jgi:hypothetical protein
LVGIRGGGEGAEREEGEGWTAGDDVCDKEKEKEKVPLYL